MKNKISGY